MISAPAPIGFIAAGVLAQRTGSTVASLMTAAVVATSAALLIRSGSGPEPVPAEAGAQLA